MASSASNPYAYTKPSTNATRSIVTGSATSPSSSNDHSDTSAKPTLQRQTTNNYAEAAAEAARSGEGTGAGAISGTDRPGVGRVQSFDHRDLKRAAHEQLLAKAGGSK